MFADEEKQELVSLFIASLEVHEANAKGTAVTVKKNGRLVELWVKLHLPELLGGGEEGERTALRIAGKKQALTLKAAVPFSSGTGDTVILTPFHHRVTSRVPTSERKKRPQPMARSSLHPIHRALAWQQKITQNSGLSARKLAVAESVPVTSVTRHLHLLNLPTHIQDFLKQLHDAKAVHFFSLRKLDPISALSLENQLEAFDLLRRRFPD